MTLEIQSDADREPSLVSFRSTDPSCELQVPGSGDLGLVIGLLPAMRRSEDLVVEGPVDPALLAATDEIQAIFCTWDRALRPTDRWYRRVRVIASTDPEQSEEIADADRGVISFFTGGVDSFHTALALRSEQPTLVYVHGFDVALADEALRAEVSRHLRAAADELGLELVELETDLQAFGDRHGVGWPDYHGAALAAVAHLLAASTATAFIPATHTYAHLEGLGSHPLVDPLWSGRSLRVVHHGADATRPDKLRVIAASAAAREHLRVCWENRAGAYNCGRCEKCVRTGAAVRIAGVEGSFPTIAAPSLRAVAGVRATGRGSPWSELRDELMATQANEPLRRSIDIVLARHQLRRWAWTRRWVR